MRKLAIGIDIGGTTINAGLVSSGGRLLKSLSLPTKFVRDTKNIQAGIISLVNKLWRPGIVGVGIGCPGREKPSQVYKNRARKAKNPPTAIILTKLLKQKVKLERKLKLPLAIANDAHCFVLGESIFGAGKNHQLVGGVTLGTGIGFGLVNKQQIQPQKTLAREFGHQIINFSDKNIYCHCQNRGCWEGYIGKNGIIRIAKKYGLKINEPKDLFELAQQNSSQAKKAWQEIGTILGLGLANIINGLSCEIIIIGGQITKSWKFFCQSMLNEVKSRSILAPCPIIKSRLKNSAILGAASLILK